MNKYNDFKIYFDLLIETEDFFSLDINTRKNLYTFIDEYYNNIIDSFDGIDKMIKMYVSCGNITKAKKFVYDRFSDKSLEYDLQDCDNRDLYKYIFFKLKRVYMLLVDNYQDINIQKDCYSKISYILNSLQNMRKNSLYGINVRNKNDIVRQIELSLTKIKSSFDKETIIILENIESLLYNIVSLQVNPNIKLTRESVLNKLATNGNLRPFGFLNSRVVNLVNSCCENNYKTYVYNVNAIEVYKNLYDDIFYFILNNINSLVGKEYFKKLIIDNLSNFIFYDQKNNITSVNIVNLKKLFDFVSRVMLIEELSIFSDIDFEKLNKFDMKVFCTIIDKLEKTDNNQVQLNNMASIYSNELAQHNFSDSVLNLFLHK